MAQLTPIGRIQTCMPTGYYISMDSTSPSPSIFMISSSTLQFCQVLDPKNYGNACLLVSSDMKYILEVTNETDPRYPACHIIRVRNCPFTITNGRPLPTNICESMLFYIKRVDGDKYKCFLESKKFCRHVLDVYDGCPAEGTRVICHPNWNDCRDNQVFILERKPIWSSCWKCLKGPELYV